MLMALAFLYGVWLRKLMTNIQNIRPILRRTALSLALMFGISAHAFAGSMPSTVVELFTSQGCSSCPPANEFVGKLSETTDALVLTYGVTYWDYLGWKDTFGTPDFTQRQRAYGQAFGIGNVYTPQIVLNGSAHSPNYSVSDVKTMPLPKHDPVVELTSHDGKLVLNSKKDVVLVSYIPGWQNVAVKAGENHGRTLRLANVVTSVTPVKAGAKISQAVEDGVAYAALVHDPKTLKVISASVYNPE